MQQEKKISLYLVFQQFRAILSKAQPQGLEQLEAEIKKIRPSENSEVFLAADFDVEEHSMGMSIYIKPPLAEEERPAYSFETFLFESLVYSDLARLPLVNQCVEALLAVSCAAYDLAAVPIFYNKDLGEYYLHFRISKAPLHERSQERVL